VKQLFSLCLAFFFCAVGLDAEQVVRLTPKYEQFLNERPRPNITIDAKRKLNGYYKQLDAARKQLARKGEFGGEYAYIVAATDLKPEKNSQSGNVTNFRQGTYYFTNVRSFELNLFDEKAEYPLLLVAEEDVIDMEDNRHLVFSIARTKGGEKTTFRSSVFRKTEQYEKKQKADKKAGRKKSRK